ncbi:MAG: glycosyltransferase family 39 protein [Thermoguttaceae bacterium]|nr:glycosyltransferase family 39 protein [Thermoguttaceae bacterium]
MKLYVSYFLIVVVGSLMTFSALRDSAVHNENGRLASGLIYFRTGRYSSFRVNPPLMSLVGAIPALLTGAQHATRAKLGISSFGREENLAGKLFVSENGVLYRTLLFTGRVCCIILILLFSLLSFQFVKELYGKAGVFFFVGMWLFNPYFLGHGHLIVPDVASGVFALFSVFRYWRWLREPNTKNVIYAGLALGLAELTKFTLLIFYPLFILLCLLYRTHKNDTVVVLPFRKHFLQLCSIFAISAILINMGYMFEETGNQLRSFKFQSKMFCGTNTHDEIPVTGGNRFAGNGNFLETGLGYLPVFLPKNYIQGIDTQRLDFEQGKPSYMRGEWSDHGWYTYYLYALLLKTPTGALALFLLAVFCTVFLRCCNLDWRDELVVLLPGVSLLLFVSSQNGFSVHSRYAIPTLPFFFLWCCKINRSFTPELNSTCPRMSRVIRRLSVFLLGWSIFSSLWVYPHSIAYFNELAAVIPAPGEMNSFSQQNLDFTAWQKVRNLFDSGPLNGPRHLLDSNVDWHQDLYNLERWCKKHPQVINLVPVCSCDCVANVLHLPASQKKQVDCNMRQWYAVSVNTLCGQSLYHNLFLKFRPKAIIGYTIYIYYLSENEVNGIL